MAAFTLPVLSLVVGTARAQAPSLPLSGSVPFGRQPEVRWSVYTRPRPPARLLSSVSVHPPVGVVAPHSVLWFFKPERRRIPS